MALTQPHLLGFHLREHRKNVPVDLLVPMAGHTEIPEVRRCGVPNW